MQLKSDEFNTIYRYCEQNCASLERWPSYFHRRMLEMQSYLELLPDTSEMKVLELGCGIGYQSAMLGKICKQVIATDLPEESVMDHAPGMKAAAELHQQLNIKNVELIPCSAEELPFEDNSMDMVFSSHVMEHIPNQQKALNEIYRVLKPGGYHVCVVPVRFEKFYAFVSFYSFLLKSSLKKAKRFFIKSVQSNQNSTSVATQTPVSLLKFFPFPPPHGYSKHFLHEVKEWSCVRWRNKMKLNGKFNVEHQSSTQLNPLLPLLGPLFPLLSARVHAATRHLELMMGKWPILRSLGINTIIVAQSKKTTTNAK